MNILFFLKPKVELEYIYDDFTVRQIMEKMNKHRYSVVPVLSRDGKYVGTISDGDILRTIHDVDFNKRIAEDMHYNDINLHRPYKAIPIDASIENLLTLATEQNFIPIVDDRKVFIGIVTRKAIIENYVIQLEKSLAKKA